MSGLLVKHVTGMEINVVRLSIYLSKCYRHQADLPTLLRAKVMDAVGVLTPLLTWCLMAFCVAAKPNHHHGGEGYHHFEPRDYDRRGEERFFFTL